MIGFAITSLKNSPIPKPFTIPRQNHFFSSYQLLLRIKTQKSSSRLVLFAQNSNKNNLTSNDKVQEQEQHNGGSLDGDDLKKDQRLFFSFKLGDILDPDPDNIFAIGLTGLLTWASVQVLWQLLVISLAILVAALKYSFIAALLLFILITLL